MKRTDWTVGEYAVRPAGEPDECFYCNQKLGEQHKDNCVIRNRTVVIEYTIKAVASVPEFWTPEDIESHRNESSWCMGNFISEVIKRNDTIEDCWCSTIEAKFVGEATEQDEERWGLEFVEKRES